MMHIVKSDSSIKSNISTEYYIGVRPELSDKRSKERMNNLHLTSIRVESEHTSENTRKCQQRTKKIKCKDQLVIQH